MKRFISFLLIIANITSAIASSGPFEEAQKTKETRVAGLPTYGTMDGTSGLIPSTSAFSQGGYAFVPLQNGTYIPVPMSSLQHQQSTSPLPPLYAEEISIKEHVPLTPRSPVASTSARVTDTSESVRLMVERDESVSQMEVTQNRSSFWRRNRVAICIGGTIITYIIIAVGITTLLAETIEADFAPVPSPFAPPPLPVPQPFAPYPVPAPVPSPPNPFAPFPIRPLFFPMQPHPPSA